MVVFTPKLSQIQFKVLEAGARSPSAVTGKVCEWLREESGLPEVSAEWSTPPPPPSQHHSPMPRSSTAGRHSWRASRSRLTSGQSMCGAHRARSSNRPSMPPERPRQEIQLMLPLGRRGCCGEPADSFSASWEVGAHLLVSLRFSLSASLTFEAGSYFVVGPSGRVWRAVSLVSTHQRPVTPPK